MQLTLHPDNFMFTLFTRPDIHLSDENPGPIDVDWDSLTSQEKQLVVSGIKKHMVISNIDVSKLEVPVVVNNRPPSFLPVPSQVVPKMLTIEDAQDTYLNSIRPLLNQTAATVKKEVGATDDIRKLRTMLEIERGDKNRKGTVALIEERLTYLMDKVATNIDNDQTILSIPQEHLDKLAESMGVTDSEEKVVTVPLDEFSSLDIS